MSRISTREAAKKLGIDHSTLAKYLADGKLSPPETVLVRKKIVHMWTEAEIEHVRRLLPKIANGRKTRYKKQSAISSQQKQRRRRRQECLRHARRSKTLIGQRPVLQTPNAP